MQFISTQKYLRLSPNKVREVVALVKKLKPAKASATLPFINKRASLVLAKVINSALAQAKEKGVSEDNLYFKEIQIGEGPRLKRGRPVSRGRWHPILKRMSHIRVVLESKEPSSAKATEVKKATEGQRAAKEVKEKPVSAGSSGEVKRVPKKKNVK